MPMIKRAPAQPSVRISRVRRIETGPLEAAAGGTGADVPARQEHTPNGETGLPRAAVSRRVLHVGCGVAAPGRLHPVFQGAGWSETRLDVDAAVAPDLVSSIEDMRPVVEDAAFDAVWSSHNIEHLETHEVRGALAEFVRVLRPTGFALIRCPDAVAVASFILAHGLEAVAYESPAGPITPLDMLFGHNASIRRGQRHMKHGTAFSEDRLGRDLIEAGFAEVRTARKSSFDLWAVAFMPQADREGTLGALAAAGLDLRTRS